MKKFVTAAAATIMIAGAAVPAFAAESAEPAPAPSARSSAVSVKDEPRAATRYCAVEQVTVSRIPRKVCKTREQWMGRGFDPLQAERK